PHNLDDPAYFPRAAFASLYDPVTRLPKSGIADNSGVKTQRLSEDEFRIFWTRPMGPPAQPVAAGDLIAFRGAGAHNVVVVDSAGVRLTDVTITSAGNF